MKFALTTILTVVAALAGYFYGSDKAYREGIGTGVELTGVHYYGEQAVQAAVILQMLKSDENAQAEQYLEKSLENAVRLYFRQIDQTEIASKQARVPERVFEVLAGFPELAASYVKQYVSAERIEGSKDFQRLLREYVHGN